MVLAEAMASRLDIIATTSGAIPEVLAGTPATLVPAGDWVGIARSLARGALSRPPGTRVVCPPEKVDSLSRTAAARRLRQAYSALLQPAGAEPVAPLSSETSRRT